MSAICGIVDFEGRNADFSVAERMRKMSFVRSGKENTAFLKGSACLLVGASEAELSSCADISGIKIEEKYGKSLALALDSFGLSPSAVLEKYLALDTDAFSLLEGAFALALYDEKKQALFLARDKKGSKPLFYFVRHGRVYFSSTVNGLLASSEISPKINRQALTAHITAPSGTFSAADIYENIFEIPEGSCLMLTPYGASGFSLRSDVNGKKIKPSVSLSKLSGGAFSGFIAYNTDKLCEYLNNSILAFAYPQFDLSFPILHELFDKCRKNGRTAIIYEDIAEPKGRYAREKADRLSSFYGAWGRGVPQKQQLASYSDYIWKLKQDLSDRLLSYDREKKAILYEIYGREHALFLIKKLTENKKEDTDLEINKLRVLGILCQLPDWVSGFSIKL